MRSILITGVTDGIGKALAERCMRQGWLVLGVGRQAAGPGHEYLQSDLREPDCGLRLGAWLGALGHDRLDVLVNNAALGWWGEPRAQSEHSIRELVQVNLRAPIALTHALMSRVVAAHGQLVFLSSVSSALPTPRYAVYTATKAALDGFARSLRVELRGRAVVQVLWPGPTRTGMQRKSGAGMEGAAFSPPEEAARRIEACIERRVPSGCLTRTVWLLRSLGTRFPSLVDRAVLGPVRRVANRSILVTGAAGGIGRALADTLSASGYNVLGLDRHWSDRPNFPTVTVDLAELSDPALSELPPIDCLVHCAGINAVGRLDRCPMGALDRVLAVNLLAPLILTRRIASSRVVGISSMSAFLGYPGASVYAATKDGLASYVRSLGGLVVYPGPTRTDHARRFSPEPSWEGRRVPPEAVAHSVVRALERHHRRAVPGRLNRALAVLGTWFPHLADEAMERAILKPLGDRVLL
ncbi:MAG: SDR family NAD(P)-dependent oxidoreductase [Candidatus Eremiobacterota bacterium]